MQKNIISLIVTLALILPAGAFAQSTDATTIIVSGKGVVRAEADLSYVSVAIEQTEKSASEAQRKAAQVMKNVLASLKSAGIPDDKVQTASFRLDPQYNYDKGQRELIGYTASNQIRVTLEDISAVGKIIDTSISAGANNVSNVLFTVKDEEPYKRDALKKAFENAREKARTIALASGLTLKKILTIKEAGAEIIPPDVGLRAMKAEGLGDGAETPIVPGKVEINASLTVVYDCVK